MLAQLIAQIAQRNELPVEVAEIAAEAVKLCAQDQIFFFEVDSDPTKLRGGFRRFSTHPGVYADPVFVTHILYSRNVSPAWQRVICAKEIVHLFDAPISKTDTEEEVSHLLDKLVGPLSSEDYGLADLQAAKDRLALYQCLPLLLPNAVLQQAREEVKAGRMTVADVAEAAVIPTELVGLMLQDDWAELNGALLEVT